MENFNLNIPTKLIFGKDTENHVGKEISQQGAEKVLLHYGRESIKKIGLYEKVVKSLNDNGIEFIELSGVQPNPRIGLVREGINLCRKENVDFILAVGGGSVIDSSKAIAMGYYHDKDVWDFFSNQTTVKRAIPIGTILTIPAAGSEMSPNTVITNDDDKDNIRKIGYGSHKLRPRFSILNPELTYSLPKNQTAYGICDMFAHILERYFSNTEYVDVTDKMCEGVMKAIIKNAKVCIDEPDNYGVRSEIMLAGTLAHNNILGIGREQDWISHTIEHELSAKYDIAHGGGLAIVFPAWMKIASQKNPDKIVQYGKEVFGLIDSENIVDDTITKTKKFFSDIGLSVTLKEIGIEPSEQEINNLAEKTMFNPRRQNSDNTIGNYVRLSKDNVKELLRKCL